MTPEPIDDAEARRIASEWHSGQASPLYALSSSGAVIDGAAREVQRDLDDCLPEDHDELEALLVYVQEREDPCRACGVGWWNHGAGDGLGECPGDFAGEDADDA